MDRADRNILKGILSESTNKEELLTRVYEVKRILNKYIYQSFYKNGTRKSEIVDRYSEQDYYPGIKNKDFVTGSISKFESNIEKFNTAQNNNYRKGIVENDMQIDFSYLCLVVAKILSMNEHPIRRNDNFFCNYEELVIAINTVLDIGEKYADSKGLVLMGD